MTNNATPTGDRPNFVFIFPDSLGANAVGCYGNALARTPTIDQLAATGIRFKHCTAPTPLCFPSRGSLHTGKYASTHGCRDNNVGVTDPEHPTLARSLRAAGYRTGYFGKTHNLNQSEWDEVFDLQPDFNQYLRARNIDVHYPETPPVEDLCAGVSALSAEDFPENLLGNMGQHFLQDRAKDRQPFFLFMSHEAPHSPWVVPETDLSLYDGIDIPLPEPPVADWQHKPENRMAYFRKRREMANDENLRWAIRIYMTLVHIVDRNIAKLVQTLDETGLRDNTIIVIAADHGDHLGNHRQLGKTLSLDQSLIHVPLILNCPSRWPSAVNGSMTELIDLMPTFCRLIGEPIPTGVQGKSLLPLLNGEQEQVRQYAHAEEHNDLWGSWMAVHDANYKYVRSDDGFEELYDLQADPLEWHNIAGDPQLHDIQQQLKDEMLRWRFDCIDRRKPRRFDWVSHFISQDTPLY